MITRGPCDPVYPNSTRVFDKAVEVLKDDNSQLYNFGGRGKAIYEMAYRDDFKVDANEVKAVEQAARIEGKKFSFQTANELRELGFPLRDELAAPPKPRSFWDRF